MTLRLGPGMLGASLLALMCACETLPAGEAQPAVLTHPTAETRAELSRVIRDALHGAPVRLAEDALTHDSVLIIARAEARDAAGLPLQGRELERPQHFRLVEHAAQCFLIEESTGRRWHLRSATCAPAPASAP
jgi:hypothetical protein